jgi:hypothetical protein
MKILDIITERQEMPKGNMGLTIFDIDDTLFHTTAQIKVIKDGKVVRSLTNQEFNNYELQPGEEFDFGEFRSAEKFAKESEPIKPMINTLKRILDRAANTKVIMLTARADFDDKDKFLSTFEKYGIDMSRIHVHRAGNLPGDEPPAYKKAVWVRKYLNTGKYNRVNLIDDSMTNLKVFKSLEQEYPNVDFDAYFVKSSGSVAVVSESRRKKKSRQRKQNSLFSRNTYGGYGAWGPGPYGGYGYDSGYSGDGGGEAESIKEGDLIPWPKGTVKVDVSDTYDWYKLGQHISNLKGLGKHDFGQGPPQTVLSFGSEPLEHEYIKYLKQLGLDTHDIDENFADGKNPQDKGDSARQGIPKKSSISTLKKIRSSDTASPRKKQLAHWQINMRQGKKKE